MANIVKFKVDYNLFSKKLVTATRNSSCIIQNLFTYSITNYTADQSNQYKVLRDEILHYKPLLI